MNKNFLASIAGFQTDFPGETFALAVSGGADSMALLHWAGELSIQFLALTVDHDLRPESAAEAEYVADVCKKLGVRHHVLKWAGEKPKTGLEEAARAARYDLMLDFCRRNNIGVLVTAHHADDQIETFLMNLGRGSGIYGLAGIRERSEQNGIIIFRPLLSVRRAELKKYCDDRKIKYFSDPMNEDEGYLRVKIRKNRHILADRLGISDERILLALENMGRVRDYIEREAGKSAQKIPVEMDAGLLLNLPDEIKFRVFSKMLRKDHPMRLSEIKNAFLKLDKESAKFTLGGCNIRKLNGKIRIWEEGTKWPKK